MKRFLVFGYYQYYPGGGSDDVQGEFDTMYDVKDFLAKNNPWDYIEVLDLEKREWLHLGEDNAYHTGGGK